MKAVILSGPNDFAPGEIEKPLIGDHDILLEMKRAAICGTDIRILEGTKTKGVRYPSVIGHEICGVISEIGKEVTGYEVGEKVAIANVDSMRFLSKLSVGKRKRMYEKKSDWL